MATFVPETWGDAHDFGLNFILKNPVYKTSSEGVAAGIIDLENQGTTVKEWYDTKASDGQKKAISKYLGIHTGDSTFDPGYRHALSQAKGTEPGESLWETSVNNGDSSIGIRSEEREVAKTLMRAAGYSDQDVQDFHTDVGRENRSHSTKRYITGGLIAVGTVAAGPLLTWATGGAGAGVPAVSGGALTTDAAVAAGVPASTGALPSVLYGPGLSAGVPAGGGGIAATGVTGAVGTAGTQVLTEGGKNVAVEAAKDIVTEEGKKNLLETVWTYASGENGQLGWEDVGRWASDIGDKAFNALGGWEGIAKTGVGLYNANEQRKAAEENAAAKQAWAQFLYDEGAPARDYLNQFINTNPLDFAQGVLDFNAGNQPGNVWNTAFTLDNIGGVLNDQFIGNTLEGNSAFAGSLFANADQGFAQNIANAIIGGEAGSEFLRKESLEGADAATRALVGNILKNSPAFNEVLRAQTQGNAASITEQLVGQTMRDMPGFTRQFVGEALAAGDAATGELQDNTIAFAERIGADPKELNERVKELAEANVASADDLEGQLKWRAGEDEAYGRSLRDGSFYETPVGQQVTENLQGAVAGKMSSRGMDAFSGSAFSGAPDITENRGITAFLRNAEERARRGDDILTRADALYETSATAPSGIRDTASMRLAGIQQAGMAAGQNIASTGQAFGSNSAGTGLNAASSASSQGLNTGYGIGSNALGQSASSASQGLSTGVGLANSALNFGAGGSTSAQALASEILNIAAGGGRSILQGTVPFGQTTYDSGIVDLSDINSILKIQTDAAGQSGYPLTFPFS